LNQIPVEIREVADSGLEASKDVEVHCTAAGERFDVTIELGREESAELP